jgi:RNA polymerase primary sigma factor
MVGSTDRYFRNFAIALIEPSGNGLFTKVMLEMEMTQMEHHDPDDPVAVYVLEVSKFEPLTKTEETKLFRELGHSGDWDEQRENVARRLIESQLMLVVSIAERHLPSGVPMLDLIQKGNIGLMNAVRSFAERPIGDFTAHAAACIDDTIAKAFDKSK